MSANTKEISAGYKRLTQLEHVKEAPDVWGAVNIVKETTEWVCDDTFKKESITYSPLWLKIVDEIIVNAIDQCALNKNVTIIYISFNKDSGEISVYNNGSCVPCILHEEYHVWIPQFIFCEFLAGSNFKDIKKSKVTGGKNGIGSKLTNAFSKSFIVETSDKSNKLYYKQKSSDGMTVIGEPEIKNYKDIKDTYKQNFTRITFLPDYNALGYKKYDAKIADILHRLLYTRCVFASVYANAKVLYNDTPVDCTSLLSLAQNVSGSNDMQLFQTTIKDTNPDGDKHNWEVVVGVSGDEGFRQISLVNGIHTRDGGAHINHIVNCISAKYKDKIKRDYKLTKWNRQLLDRYLFIFLKCEIENPSFNNQAKEQLMDPSDFPFHKIGATFMKKVYDAVKPHLDANYISKISDKETSKKKKIGYIKKYDPAMKAGTKDSHKCNLIIPEGDSAEGFASRGITDKHNKLSMMYYGIFNIQGKPVNARKEITIKKDPTGKCIKIRSEKLKNNERWASLVEVLGLDYTYTYSNTPQGDTEMSKLRYGKVIVAVDQDVDGVGHIFGLILNFFNLFWPNLITRGFIQRMATPLIRAFPTAKNKTVLSFYSNEEYRIWCTKTFGSLIPKGWKVKFYKGLAGHDDKAISYMFKNFDSTLYTYNCDSETDKLFEVYFGKSTVERKDELRQPIVQYDIINNTVLCNNQLKRETKEYQLDDIIRSLPHVVDGLRPAARIAIAGAREKFKSANHEVKVYQLTAAVTQSMNYAHGDKSLNDTIVRLAQRFPGARNLPFLYGVGNFGSRKKGGSDAGAPRYISVKLNKQLVDAMFPVEDDILLQYRYDDGERCEPLYYIPVLPCALLENFCIPATGWKASLYAREINSVISNIKAMINGGKVKRMKYWNLNNNSKVIENDDSICLMGNVKLTGNTVKIVELPPGVWPDVWKENILSSRDAKKKDGSLKNPDYQYIVDIYNNSSDTEIDIQVILKTGFKSLSGKYGNDEMHYLVDFLKIYIKDVNITNCLGKNNLIYESPGYEDMLKYWFDERKVLYAMRCDRLEIILRWKIKMYENMIMYSTNYPKYNLAGASRSKVDSCLDEEKYIMINKAHLEHPPNTIAIDKLEEYILEDKSYDYLLRLCDLDRLDKPNKARKEKLKELKKQYDDITLNEGPFKGSHIWLREIDNVTDVIHNGITNGWGFGEDEYRY